ncbi:MAG: HAD-IA family hydrolase [Bacillota bacterium]|nr:HAD-IA family hydrolase [Bacillota bacterium]
MIKRDLEKILLFDLGNILVRLNSVNEIWTGTDPSLPRDLPELDQLWSRSQAVVDYETGRIRSLPAFYTAVGKEVPIAVSEDEFYRIFNQAIGDTFPETHAMLALLQDRYRLFLLSNTSREHWAICRDALHLDGYFTKTFLSYDMGIMKPDPASYQIAIDGIGVDPENIWYYDDRAENVYGAINKGINAHISFGGITLINDLRKHGFIGSDELCS